MGCRGGGGHFAWAGRRTKNKSERTLASRPARTWPLAAASGGHLLFVCEGERARHAARSIVTMKIYTNKPAAAITIHARRDWAATANKAHHLTQMRGAASRASASEWPRLLIVRQAPIVVFASWSAHDELGLEFAKTTRPCRTHSEPSRPRSDSIDGAIQMTRQLEWAAA
jgi:hypothetical protein